MMETFVFPGLTTRIVFGHGTLEQVSDELDRLGHRRGFILSTQRQEDVAKGLAKKLGSRAAGHFAGAAMHTPVDVTEDALAAFTASGADAVISLGGGSTIGLGKAIAARSGADQIVIPTTYSGSEMTDILGETSGGEKITRRSADIRPETVIYDVDLTLSLPTSFTVSSALNAVAHAMEALYAPERNPVIQLMCEDALRAMREGLPRVVLDPADRKARAQVLYGAWASSSALGHVSMGLHHKLAHVLGGSFNTSHAETHAVLLPYTAAFNEVSVPEMLKPIATIFGGGSAAAGLWDFAQSVGSPLTLRHVGISEADLDKVASIAVQNGYPNPRQTSTDAIRVLLQAAWEGRRPDTWT